MFKVPSHTMWPSMFMCCGLFAISNVVVSLTIHDNFNISKNIYVYQEM